MSIGASTARLGGEQVASAARPHLYHLDVIRLLTCIGVVAIHTVELIQPDSRPGGAVVIALHTSREMFFFVTALALTYSTGAAVRGVASVSFWRRRYPLILLPYLTWTVLYWVGDSVTWGQQWPPDTTLTQLGADLLGGWNHLYFLFVTMQFYAVFPLVGWAVRRTWRWHWLVLAVSAAVQLLATGLLQYGWTEGVPGLVQLWFQQAEIDVLSYQFAFVAGALAGAHLDVVVSVLRRYGRWLLVGAAGGLLLGEAVYLYNLLQLSQPTQVAAGALQPALVPLTAAAVLALAWVADWVVRRHPPEARLWGLLRGGAEASFGIFLAHVAVLYILVQPAVRGLLGLNALPGPALTAVTFALTVAATWALVEVLRRSPLSRVLTGRARIA